MTQLGSFRQIWYSKLWYLKTEGTSTIEIWGEWIECSCAINEPYAGAPSARCQANHSFYGEGRLISFRSWISTQSGRVELFPIICFVISSAKGIVQRILNSQSCHAIALANRLHVTYSPRQSGISGNQILHDTKSVKVGYHTDNIAQGTQNDTCS